MYKEVDANFELIKKEFKLNDNPIELVEKAYIFAKTAHKDQIRKDGKPYISHPVSVALILAKLGFNEDVISAASHLLKSSGRLCICQRPERLSDIICLMRQYKLEAKRIRTVSKKVGEEPWLVLVEGRRDAKSGIRILPPLFVYNENGDLSEEMIAIYGDYKEGH